VKIISCQFSVCGICLAIFLSHFCFNGISFGTQCENDMGYTFVIPCSKKDLDKIDIVLNKLFENFQIKQIVVICPNGGGINLDKVISVDEDKLYNGLTLQRIKDICHTNNISRSPNWYFQQFLKMSYANVCVDDCYIVWDADSIPLKHVEFRNSKTDKLKFFTTGEHYIPYFNTIDMLFEGNVSKCINKSFISEAMIIDKKIMLELIRKIENNHKICGHAFYEKILSCVRQKTQAYSFSEYETYGNFVLTYYPKRYEVLGANRYRRANGIVNIHDDDELKWIAQSFDAISIEKWDKIKFKKKIAYLLSKFKFIRKHFTFKQILKFTRN
jgi:hypothetical protein